MSHLPSLPPDAGLLEFFKEVPGAARPLLDYTQAVLRGDSPLTVAERELIGAYVSGLNACRFCRSVHSTIATEFGVPRETLTSALSDIDSSAVEDRMKPLLHFARKLTETPGQITADDARTVLDAGWEEGALRDAVTVCALLNMMNRIVDGLGLASHDGYVAAAASLLADGGYEGVKATL
ncbi:carboxymuconolactone decarboxylase family protein [Haloechinothrix sp. LS1_15]|uniref:carboxymuconolactone decarboxylase family protein n=1 Tax=Haloechinothrix sp. LS1_15 TaxID=2652248 RepID=UPI002946F165|nr:carboxymuconolactone decarboxylase family protein [Haloechinothrix sp. LS1_15]MDV6013614.1 peroxidase [Haloechinothrix sp. LS1_15]